MKTTLDPVKPVQAQGSGVNPAPLESSLAEQLIEIAAPHLKFLEEEARIGIDDSLAEAGLDSMASINLLLDIEDEVGVSIPDELIEETSFETIRNILALVEKAKNA